MFDGVYFKNIEEIVSCPMFDELKKTNNYKDKQTIMNEFDKIEKSYPQL